MNKGKKLIVVQACFEGIHSWPDCSIPEVWFLKHPHRHIFYVKVKWEVNHNNRDKEFIVMKQRLEKFLKELTSANPETPLHLGRLSCEDIADQIHDEFPDCCFVSVFEDNENGAEAHYK